MVDPLIDVMVLPASASGPGLVVVDVGLVEQVLVEVVGLTVMLGPNLRNPGNGVGVPAEFRGSAGPSSRQVEQTGLG
jgi:hypothetical protein